MLALLWAASWAAAPTLLSAQTAPTTPPPPQAPAPEPTLPPEQLDSLVAPIALYPDTLLSQVLVASTYPLEVIQLQQWLAKNKDLKDKALADAVAKQPWDPSIQALAAIPDAVKRLSEDIAWTTSLGNAFLAQQKDVMDAIQRMRQKAQATGALKTNEQQKVETQVVEQKTVIVVEQANPQVIYVPSYNPTVVYGPPVYAYPPVYYPPPPPMGAALVGFTVGVMVTAAWHGGAPYHCGWGHSTVVVNNHNTYVRNNNINNVNRNVNNVNRGNTNWNHDPKHRGGAPYANTTTANKYGGRTEGARQQPAGARQQPSASNRAASPNLSPASTANRGSTYSSGGGGGGDRIGSQSISSSGPSRSGFNGGSDGFSGRNASASSSRGASSYGSRGGGASRGGGGGFRGGGGRRGR